MNYQNPHLLGHICFWYLIASEGTRDLKFQHRIWAFFGVFVCYFLLQEGNRSVVCYPDLTRCHVGCSSGLHPSGRWLVPSHYKHYHA